MVYLYPLHLHHSFYCLRLYYCLRLLYWTGIERIGINVLFLILVEILWFFSSPFSMMLTMTLLYISFTVLRYVPCILYFGDFYHNMLNFGQNYFLLLMSWSCCCLSVYVADYLFIYISWNIAASVIWNWFDHGAWSFWCVLKFSLSILLRKFASMCLREIGL